MIDVRLTVVNELSTTEVPAEVRQQMADRIRRSFDRLMWEACFGLAPGSLSDDPAKALAFVAGPVPIASQRVPGCDCRGVVHMCASGGVT